MPDVLIPQAEEVFACEYHNRADVTVAVTLFNYADFVLAALESISAQDVTDIDLVVVDDCSRDDGLARVRDWMGLHSSRFGRCRLMRHPINQGIAGARNQGFSRAMTPFVFVLDADNEIYPRCLTVCTEAANKQKADAVYTLIEVFGDKQEVINSDTWDPKTLQLGNYIDAMALLRRSAWQRVGGYRRMPVGGWEDYDLWLKFIEEGMEVSQVPEILCRYRRHKTSLLQTVTNDPENVKLLQDDLSRHHPAYIPASTRTLAEGLVRWKSSESNGSRNVPGPMCRLDCRAIPEGRSEVRAFMVVRNEALRLPFTLRHHRSIGIDRFFVVDNGSTDGTIELLLSEPDVHLFATQTPFSQANYGMDWIHSLLMKHGLNRWTLIIDADEHFVFPNSESLPIRDYCLEVERAGMEAVPALVLDMYARGPIAAAQAGGQPSLLHACPYFDGIGYTITGMLRGMPAVHGGPRSRLFWPELNVALQVETLDHLVELAWKEETYLEANADVRDAVQQGFFRNGFEHFERFGRIEGREIWLRPVADWDENAYLRSHPDVAHAIEQGLIKSGLDHFVRYGRFEGRILLPDESPCLSIIPVVKWSLDKRFILCRHGLEPSQACPPDEFGGVMLHFKMLEDFPRRVRTEASRGEHWMRGKEFRRYAEMFVKQPQMDPYFEGSCRYAGSNQLVQLGYMKSAYLSDRKETDSEAARSHKLPHPPGLL